MKHGPISVNETWAYFCECNMDDFLKEVDIFLKDGPTCNMKMQNMHAFSTYLILTLITPHIQSARSQIDRMLKLKLRFSKCTVTMGRDHGHPYILSTTVLGDI